LVGIRAVGKEQGDEVGVALRPDRLGDRADRWLPGVLVAEQVRGQWPAWVDAGIQQQPDALDVVGADRRHDPGVTDSLFPCQSRIS